MQAAARPMPTQVQTQVCGGTRETGRARKSTLPGHSERCEAARTEVWGVLCFTNSTEPGVRKPGQSPGSFTASYLQHTFSEPWGEELLLHRLVVEIHESQEFEKTL